MNKNNVHFDMRNQRVTYGQMDKLLSELGFARHPGAPGWVWYQHAASATEIILADKKANEKARPSEVVATRVHLVAKGLVGEDEFDSLLAAAPESKKATR